MPSSATNTSKPKVLSEESTLTENVVVENFSDLHHIIQTSPEEGVKAKEVVLFFSSKRDEMTGLALDPLCNQAEKTLNEYFECMSNSEQQAVRLVICRMNPEELHLLSLSRIYHWCILENIKCLPTLVRLDGMRMLSGEDVCSFMKLGMFFSKMKKVDKYSHEVDLNIEQKPRSVVLNVRRGDCSFHGKVLKTVPEKQYISESEEEEPEREDVAMYRNERLGRILCIGNRAFKVQRRPVEEPVVVVAEEPVLPKPVKKQKGKKDRKGKGKKGKKGKK